MTEKPKRILDDKAKEVLDGQIQKRKELIRSHLKDLDTGDIILFSRNCRDFNLYGAFLCMSTKFMHQTEWDHIGVVLKEEASGELKLLEAGFSGIKLYDLEEQLLRTKAPRVAARHLVAARPPDFQAKAWAFAREVDGRSYNYEFAETLRAGLRHPPKAYRRHLHGRILELDARAQRLERHLRKSTAATAAAVGEAAGNDEGPAARRPWRPRPGGGGVGGGGGGGVFLRHALAAELDRCRADRAAALRELAKVDRSALENRADPGYMFCSELAAALWQRLGLLPGVPSATDYLPRDFASEGAGQLPRLPHGAFLHGEVDLRRGGRPLPRPAAPTGDRPPADRAERDFIARALAADPRGAALALADLTGEDRRAGAAAEDACARGAARALRAPAGAVLVSAMGHGDHPWAGMVGEHGLGGGGGGGPGKGGGAAYVVVRGELTATARALDEERTPVTTTYGPGNVLFADEWAHVAVRSGAGAAGDAELWKIDLGLAQALEEPSGAPPLAQEAALAEALRDHACLRGGGGGGSGHTLGPAALAGLFRPLVFEENQVMGQAGERVSSLGVILEGKAEVITAEGKHIMWLCPGATFGETSMLFDMPRGSTIVACKGPCRIAALGKASFLRLVDPAPFRHMRDFFLARATAAPGAAPAAAAAKGAAGGGGRGGGGGGGGAGGGLTARALSEAMGGAALPPHLLAGSDLRRRGALSLSDFLHFDLLLARDRPEVELLFRLACNSAGLAAITRDQYLAARAYATREQLGAPPAPATTAERRAVARLFGRDGRRTVARDEFAKFVYSRACPPALHGFVAQLRAEQETFLAAVQDRLAVDLNRRRTGLHAHAPGSGFFDHAKNVLLTGGALCVITTAMAPLERLKLVMQVQSPGTHFLSVGKGLSTLVRQDGLRSLWRGNALNLLRVLPLLGFQLAAYQCLKRTDAGRGLAVGFWTEDTVAYFERGEWSLEARHLAAGVAAGLAAGLAVHPLDVVRANLTAARGPSAPGALAVVRRLARQDGGVPRALARGLAPGLAWSAAALGLGLPAVAALKPLVAGLRPGHPLLSAGGGPSVEDLLLRDHAARVAAGAAAGLVALVVAHPFDVVRRRMQPVACGQANTSLTGILSERLVFFRNEEGQVCPSTALLPSARTARGPGPVRMATAVLRQEGLRGLYRGFVPAAIKMVPTVAMSYVFALKFVV